MFNNETHPAADQRHVAFLATPLTDEERRDLNLFLEREDFESAVAIEGEDKVVYRMPHGTEEVAREKIAGLVEYLRGLQGEPPRFGIEGEASD